MMMDTILLMIMLTGGGEKPVDASFIEVETLAECEERVKRARAVFPVAGVTYLSHHCVASTVKFEPFPHNPEPVGPKYYFDLVFDGKNKTLVKAGKYSTMQDCIESVVGTCVLSYQNQIE